jgi:hypothetical protein
VPPPPPPPPIPPEKLACLLAFIMPFPPPFFSSKLTHFLTCAGVSWGDVGVVVEVVDEATLEVSSSSSLLFSGLCGKLLLFCRCRVGGIGRGVVGRDSEEVAKGAMAPSVPVGLLLLFPDNEAMACRARLLAISSNRLFRRRPTSSIIVWSLNHLSPANCSLFLNLNATMFSFLL